MALDASIYNAFAPRVRSVEEYNAIADEQEAQKQQRMLNALSVQAKQQELGMQQRQMQDADSLRQEQTSMFQQLPTMDRSSPDFMTQLQAKFPRAAGGYLKDFSEQQKTAAQIEKERALGGKAMAETERERLATAKERIGLVLQAVSSAKDQASYAQAVQMLAANGVDVSTLPPQFDPQYVASAGQQAMTAAQRLDQEWKRRDFDLKASNELIGPDGKVNQTLVGVKAGIASAGAPRNSVSVNTGQKGLDNEFKLRGEFKQEPVYKAHQEMQAAHGQIKQAIAQASPAGDLAAATKIMKLLDPGSVVRESELGMAMQASGLMDRITNYGNMVITGQKLTPTQRKDFATLADRLMGESVKAYNGKRSEYQRLGGEYGLNADRALGPDSPPVAPSAGDGWSIKPKGK